MYVVCNDLDARSLMGLLNNYFFCGDKFIVQFNLERLFIQIYQNEHNISVVVPIFVYKYVYLDDCKFIAYQTFSNKYHKS